MINAIIASAALLATTVAAKGSAIVINSCSYTVQLDNTPAMGGGYSTISQPLSPGASYSQEWTELSNGMGWSLKLSKGGDMSNIMQYEYTFHNDGIIWYDLSDVNGNPWDGNWEITATGDCTPKQQAYRYSTDDAYGMQDCPDSSSVTVTLCSGDSGSGSGSGTGSPAPSVPLSSPSDTGSAPPSSTWGLQGDKVAAPAGDMAAEPSTTSTPETTPSPAQDPNGIYITNWHTTVVTEYVTATPSPKRHVHHPRHAHRHL